MKTLKSSEEFVIGKNNISYISDIFKEHFHGIEFKREDMKLYSKTLNRQMNDEEIIKEWNPEPVTLGDILYFLETASHTESYVFHVKNKDGVLWAVLCRWGGDGWYFLAFPLYRPHSWFDGYQFLSRSFNGDKIIDALALAIARVKEAGYVIYKPV